MDQHTQQKAAFSLVELAVVLTIIGLIVGGVMAGQELIRASAVQAQIKQVDQYRVALKVFEEKYFALPGDLPEPRASELGFKARGTNPGQGDGNGVLQARVVTTAASYYICGEHFLFWTDLSKAGLITENFTAATNVCASLPPLKEAIPTAKLTGNYLFTAGGYPHAVWNGNFVKQNVNYFAIQGIDNISAGWVEPALSMKVSDAFSIDTKIDDGKPMAGKVSAMYLDNGNIVGMTIVPVAASSSTCMDNGNNASNPMVYSMSYQNGEGNQCSLFLEMN